MDNGEGNQREMSQSDGKRWEGVTQARSEFDAVVLQLQRKFRFFEELSPLCVVTRKSKEEYGKIRTLMGDLLNAADKLKMASNKADSSPEFKKVFGKVDEEVITWKMQLKNLSNLIEKEGTAESESADSVHNSTRDVSGTSAVKRYPSKGKDIRTVMKMYKKHHSQNPMALQSCSDREDVPVGTSHKINPTSISLTASNDSGVIYAKKSSPCEGKGNTIFQSHNVSMQPVANSTSALNQLLLMQFDATQQISSESTSTRNILEDPKDLSRTVAALPPSGNNSEKIELPGTLSNTYVTDQNLGFQQTVNSSAGLNSIVNNQALPFQNQAAVKESKLPVDVLDFAVNASGIYLNETDNLGSEKTQLDETDAAKKQASNKRSAESNKNRNQAIKDFVPMLPLEKQQKLTKKSSYRDILIEAQDHMKNLEKELQRTKQELEEYKQREKQTNTLVQNILPMTPMSVESLHGGQNH